MKFPSPDSHDTNQSFTWKGLKGIYKQVQLSFMVEMEPYIQPNI